MKTKFPFFLLISFLTFSLPGYSQFDAFQPGEKLTYSVSYSALGIYVKAGSASFSANKATDGNSSLYHLVGEGATNSGYDWIFKVRDRYESYYDATTMQPVKFVRNVNEGSYKKYEEVIFDTQNNKAITKKGAYKVPSNIQDVISSVYYMRSVDFSKYNAGDKIPFSMFIGSTVYPMYIRYAGKETIKTKYGRFTAIKIHPLLLKGDTFKEEDDMTIWVTDDSNHLPLRIESKLRVGRIQVELSQFQNLKYPILVAKL